MRQNNKHKSLIISTLEILDETFETNETVFRCFFELSLFLHILKTVFDVSFSLKSVSFCLILPHSVSFQILPNIADPLQRSQYKLTKNKMKHTKRHKLFIINTLCKFSGIFETNETLFLTFLAIHLFFHLLNTAFDVSFCSISVSFCPILFHNVSFNPLHRIISNNKIMEIYISHSHTFVSEKILNTKYQLLNTRNNLPHKKIRLALGSNRIGFK